MTSILLSILTIVIVSQGLLCLFLRRLLRSSRQAVEDFAQLDAQQRLQLQSMELRLCRLEQHIPKKTSDLPERHQRRGLH